MSFLKKTNIIIEFYCAQHWVVSVNKENQKLF